MAINKIQYGNTVLIDLTDTTAEATDVLAGKYFYDIHGVRTLGTGTGGVDGDNLGYGILASNVVGYAVVGTAVLGSENMVGTTTVGSAIVGG